MVELLVAVDDYCIKKVALTAAICGIQIKITNGVTHEELLSYDVAAKSMILRSSSGDVITQHLAILRHLADMSPMLQLMGVSAFDVAQVDQWLAFSWSEVGIIFFLFLESLNSFSSKSI